MIPIKDKYYIYYLANFKLITLRKSLVSTANLVEITIIFQYDKSLSVKKSLECYQF